MQSLSLECDKDLQLVSNQENVATVTHLIMCTLLYKSVVPVLLESLSISRSQKQADMNTATKIILPTALMSLETEPSPGKPFHENAAQPMKP